MITIDGSFGEGGGQILRTSLSLSLMAIAGGGAFTALPPSRHTTTNIEVIKQFLDLEISSRQTDNRVWRIEVTS